MTLKPIKTNIMYTNINLKKAIESFLEKNPWAYEEVIIWRAVSLESYATETCGCCYWCKDYTFYRNYTNVKGLWGATTIAGSIAHGVNAGSGEHSFRGQVPDLRFTLDRAVLNHLLWHRVVLTRGENIQALQLQGDRADERLQGEIALQALHQLLIHPHQEVQ